MANTTVALPYSEWQTPYLAAMLEINNIKLRAKINEAEAAIFDRLQALTETPNYQDERTALDDAVRNLRILKRDNLKFPDWR